MNAGRTTRRSSGAQWGWAILALLVIAGLIGWRAFRLGAFSLSNDEGAYLMWAWLVNS